MNPHRSGMDYLLEIDERTNGRSAEQIRAARKDITAVLRRAA